jgi:uroporphyrinogen III methyltransferase/synthase
MVPDQALDGAFARLADYGWILFTSPAGVRYFWQMLEARGFDARSLGKARVAGFGAATSTALRRRGIVPDLSTRTFEVDEVLSRLERVQPVTGSSILFPHGDRPSPIAARLRAHGADVNEVRVFETRKVSTDPEEVFRDAEVLVLPSSTAATDVAEAIRSTSFAGRVVAIGPSTAQTALARGLTVDAIAPDHTVRGIVRTVLGFFDVHDRGDADLLELVSALTA